MPTCKIGTEPTRSCKILRLQLGEQEEAEEEALLLFSREPLVAVLPQAATAAEAAAVAAKAPILRMAAKEEVELEQLVVVRAVDHMSRPPPLLSPPLAL